MPQKLAEQALVRQQIIKLLLDHYEVNPLDLVTWQIDAILDAVRLLMRTVKKAVE